MLTSDEVRALIDDALAPPAAYESLIAPDIGHPNWGELDLDW